MTRKKLHLTIAAPALALVLAGCMAPGEAEMASKAET